MLRPLIYTAEAIPVMDSETASAGAQIVATLPALANKFTLMTHLTITAAQVAVVCFGTVTVVGPATTLNYIFVETVSAGGWLYQAFDPPVPGAQINTAIVVTLSAISGGSNAAVTVYGYQG